MTKILKNVFLTTLIFTPIILYWFYVSDMSLTLSSKAKNWIDLATFVDGIYGTFIAGFAIVYLIKQIKAAQESNSTALSSLITTQETANFEALKFKLKLIYYRIKEFNKLNVEEKPELWVKTFRTLILDLKMIELSYRETFETEVSRVAIQTILSNVINWLLKENESKFIDNERLFFIEQVEACRDISFNKLSDSLNILKISRLQTVGDNEPDYL